MERELGIKSLLSYCHNPVAFTPHHTMDYTVNIIERNGEYFLQEVFAVTEFQYVEQVTAGPFKDRWEADVKRSWMYSPYQGATDEYCRLQH